MNKLRSDSAFCQLTPEQTEALEGWLFEERLSYPKVLEKLKAEFGLDTSLTAIRRFYKRLEMERSRESLMDVVEMSGAVREALKAGNLKPGMLVLANKCAFELMMQPREDWCVRELTALLRAITCAEAGARKQAEFEREQERLRVIKVDREWRELARRAEREEEEEEVLQEQAAAEVAKKADNELNADVDATSPRPSPPKAEREIRPEASATPGVSGCPGPSDPLAPRGTSGERAGERGSSISRNLSGADAPWQPNVLEHPECSQGNLEEEAERRLTPLNAA
jgi:hypothetical protein